MAYRKNKPFVYLTGMMFLKMCEEIVSFQDIGFYKRNYIMYLKLLHERKYALIYTVN